MKKNFFFIHSLLHDCVYKNRIRNIGKSLDEKTLLFGKIDYRVLCSSVRITLVSNGIGVVYSI